MIHYGNPYQPTTLKWLRVLSIAHIMIGTVSQTAFCTRRGFSADVMCCARKTLVLPGGRQVVRMRLPAAPGAPGAPDRTVQLCSKKFKAFFRWWKADQNPGAHGAHLSTSVSKATWLSLKSWTSFARYSHNNHDKCKRYQEIWSCWCKVTLHTGLEAVEPCQHAKSHCRAPQWVLELGEMVPLRVEICRWSSESPEVERLQRSKGMVDWRLWWLFLQLGLRIQVGLSVSKQTLCLDLFGSSIIIRIYSMHVKQAPPGSTPLIYDIIHRFTMIHFTILGRQTDIIRLRWSNSPVVLRHSQVTLTRAVDQLTKGHSL